MAKTSAFKKGYLAYENDYAIEDCPFDPDKDDKSSQQYKDWCEGWRKSQSDDNE